MTQYLEAETSRAACPAPSVRLPGSERPLARLRASAARLRASACPAPSVRLPGSGPVASPVPYKRSPCFRGKGVGGYLATLDSERNVTRPPGPWPKSRYVPQRNSRIRAWASRRGVGLRSAGLGPTESARCQGRGQATSQHGQSVCAQLVAARTRPPPDDAGTLLGEGMLGGRLIDVSALRRGRLPLKMRLKSWRPAAPDHRNPPTAPRIDSRRRRRRKVGRSRRRRPTEPSQRGSAPGGHQVGRRRRSALASEAGV
jgi:hypothetical protein